ncbi:MAG: GNAT family N-acetyltransferase [Candidatus Hodarchaeaceae archaeon]|nr:GNAT family N-acetyltransferase [Candidatus Hodarchaeaceae archaeon]
MLKFVARDGSTFIFREPKMKDAKACLEYINELVKEGAPINIDKEVALRTERARLRRQIDGIKRGQIIMLVAEKNGEIVSVCELRRRTHRMSHVANFGIGVKRRYRRLGIAEAISREALRMAERAEIEIVRSCVFEDNEPSKALHGKLGFVREAVLRDEIKDDGVCIKLTTPS